MDIGSAATFLAAVAVGVYLHTLTGFALGIVVLAVVAITDSATVAETAIALSIMSLLNALIAIPRVWRDIHWASLRRSMYGMLPGLLLGIWLLEVISAHYTHLLKLMVGLLVLGGGAILLMQPRPRSQSAGLRSYLAAGSLSGVLSGLFSIGGPPLVYHLYREPLPIPAVRSTLLTTFTFMAAGRLAVIGAQSRFDAAGVQIGLLALPVVALSTWLCMRYPPKLSDTTSRRAAFSILVVMGLFTIAMGIRDLASI